MKYRLAILIACLLTISLLAGCKESGSSASGSFDSGSSSFVSGSGGLGSSGGSVPVGHMPEPATVALLGSGLLAYAFIRRKMKK